MGYIKSVREALGGKSRVHTGGHRSGQTGSHSILHNHFSLFPCFLKRIAPGENETQQSTDAVGERKGGTHGRRDVGTLGRIVAACFVVCCSFVVYTSRTNRRWKEDRKRNLIQRPNNDNPGQ